MFCLALALCAGLPACSVDPAWPSLGKISDLSNILSPEERQKAVQDLQKDNPNQNTSADAVKASAKTGQ